MRVPLDHAAALAAMIGRRVRALRESLGITQEKLAYESGLRSKGTLSKIESGRQLATLGVLELIARRLGVELFELLIDPDEGSPRHELIERTRALSARELRVMLRATDPPPERPSPPFTYEERPPRDAATPRVIPLIGIDLAAGTLDAPRSDRGTRWVRPNGTRRLHRGCFVARVVGRSMEPSVPDGAWAVFTQRVSDDPTGRVVIARYGGHVDADTATSFTVKRFRALPAPRGSESRWREVQLVPENPSFERIVVPSERLGELSIVAELVEVLGASNPRRARET